MEKMTKAVISGADPVGGVKSFFGQKIIKVMTFLGVGGFFKFFFFEIHSIYDISLIRSFDKSFLDTLQK